MRWFFVPPHSREPPILTQVAGRKKCNEIKRSTCSNLGWERVPTWKHLYVHKKVSFLLSVYVDDLKWSGNGKILDVCGRV